MSFALTSYLPCPDRVNPVTASCCQWCENGCYCTQTEPQNRCQRQTSRATKKPVISVTDDMAVLPRKLTALIPIALRCRLTAWLPPAVPSLEACKTPAR